MPVLGEYIKSFLADHSGGTVSVWYGGLSGQPSYARAEHIPHYAASTIKLPLLVAAYRCSERAELDLDAALPVHNLFRSAADGTPFRLDRTDDQDDETWELVGGHATLRELALRSIVKSGNLATNLVLEQVGTEEVAEVLKSAGCTPDTVVQRGIEDAAAREAGLDNLVTAADLALVMRGIADRSLASERTCIEVERVVSRQEHRGKIPAGLPTGTYVANKTGWVDGVAHDVALVRPESAEPYVLVVCTSVDAPEAEMSALIAGISRRIWEARVP